MFEYTDKLAQEIAKQIVASYVQVKDIGEENGTFKVIASTEAKDRHGEVVKADGWLLDQYMKNPVILFGHDYRSVDSIVGKATRVYVENKQLIVEGIFAPTESAQVVRQLYDQGFVKTVSVGFIVKKRNAEDQDIIEQAELLELSFVPVPANPEALSMDGKMLAKALEKGIVVKEGDEPASPTGLNPEDEKPVDAEAVIPEEQPDNKAIMAELKALNTKLDSLQNNIEKGFTKPSAKSDETDEGNEEATEEEEKKKLELATNQLKAIAGLVGKTLSEIKL